MSEDFEGDGARVRKMWSAEVRSLLNSYRHFETLIPHATKEISGHPGEDGRYVEVLLRSYLQKYLPKDLEVLTGFILRPAMITARNGNERSGCGDRHSTQLDILVFDTAHYPLFHRFENSVIAPPEGVVAVLSVKKHLRSRDIVPECDRLGHVADLCRCKRRVDDKDEPENHAAIRGPFLGLVSMGSDFTRQENMQLVQKTAVEKVDAVLVKLLEAYSDEVPYFDKVVGYVGALEEWSVTKRRPKGVTKAALAGVSHSNADDSVDWGLQYILSGILSVYYEGTRGETRRRPGFIGFKLPPDHHAKSIQLPVKGLYEPEDGWKGINKLLVKWDEKLKEESTSAGEENGA